MVIADKDPMSCVTNAVRPVADSVFCCTVITYLAELRAVYVTNLNMHRHQSQFLLGVVKLATVLCQLLGAISDL